MDTGFQRKEDTSAGVMLDSAMKSIPAGWRLEIDRTPMPDAKDFAYHWTRPVTNPDRTLAGTEQPVAGVVMASMLCFRMRFLPSEETGAKLFGIPLRTPVTRVTIAPGGSAAERRAFLIAIFPEKSAEYGGTLVHPDMDAYKVSVEKVLRSSRREEEVRHALAELHAIRQVAQRNLAQAISSLVNRIIRDGNDHVGLLERFFAERQEEWLRMGVGDSVRLNDVVLVRRSLPEDAS